LAPAMHGDRHGIRHRRDPSRRRDHPRTNASGDRSRSESGSPPRL